MTEAPSLSADPQVVRSHLAKLHACAATAFEGQRQAGMMQLVRIHPLNEDTLAFQFAIGEVDLMAAEAVRQANAGFNVYVEGRTVRQGVKKRGRLEDTVGVFALTIDADADKDKAGALPIQPTFVIETSPGNFHYGLALDHALPVEQAQALGAAIRHKVGADAATGVLTQPYRVAGTPNFPGKRKIARGRVATPTSIVNLDGRIWSVAELREAFPEPERRAAGRGTRDHEAGVSDNVSETVEAIVAETDAPDRSERFFDAVRVAFREGLTADAVEAAMRRHPEGCAGKYLEPYDRLRREIDRAWAKVEDHAAGVRGEAGEATASYPDNRVSLPEAEAAVRNVVSDFFGSHVEEWRPRFAAWKAEARAAKALGEAPPDKPLPVSWGARIETAIGKTATAIKDVAQAVKPGMKVVYAVPYHHLADEIAERFKAEGVTARAYRGYTASDPETEGLAMCLDLAAIKDARQAGSKSILESVCERKDKATGHVMLCPFHHRCGMQKQREAAPDLWVIPHSSLYHKRPRGIGHPDALVIDEAFTRAAIPDEPIKLKLSDIEAAPIQPDWTASILTNAANDLQVTRGNFLRALRAHNDNSPIQRDLLLTHGMTATAAGSAIKFEYDRKKEPEIVPGMDAEDRKAASEAVAAHNSLATNLGELWREVQAFLIGDADLSGRLSIKFNADRSEATLERLSLEQIRDGWHAPALLLDATLPPAELLAPILRHPVEVKADVTAVWSPHVRVRQIIGAPVSATKLGIVKKKRREGEEEKEERRGKWSTRDLRRHIILRAAVAFPGTMVVIGPKKWMEKLRELRLPSNVDTGHFGAIAGIDRWRDAAGLICIGQERPGPDATEPQAAAITGRLPIILKPNEWKAIAYPTIPGGIRLADGRVVGVQRYQHPDPTVDAIRAQITEAGLIQAIGRIRPLRRDAASPAFIDIISDVPLPIIVHEVATWESVQLGAWAEMVVDGVTLDSPADMTTAWPEVWPNEAVAKKAARRGAGSESTGTSVYRDNPFIDRCPRARRFSYQRPGVGKKWRTGAYDPAVITDLMGWLTGRIGPIAKLEIGEAP